MRQILIAEGITFQRTKTWKESPDPLKEQKLGRIEWLLNARMVPFTFDEFGPLTIKPVGGTAWAPEGRPERLRANYHKPHGSRQLFAWYSIGADQLTGNLEPCKGSLPTLRALQAIRASIDDGEPIHVILDNLNHHKNHGVRQWCTANNVELVFTPTYGSWANPIEAHFGPLRQFVIANSDHKDHRALARAIRSTSPGATPTPDTRPSWKPNDATEPNSEVKPNDDGDTRNPPPHNARTYVVRALVVAPPAAWAAADADGCAGDDVHRFVSIVIGVRAVGGSGAGADQFLVDEFVGTPAAELAARAGTLDAAEGQLGAVGADDVHVHHASLDGVGDAGGLLRVGGEQVRAKAERRVVGHVDCFGLTADLVDHGDGAEQFLVVRGVAAANVGEHTRREESTRSLASRCQGRSAGHSSVDRAARRLAAASDESGPMVVSGSVGSPTLVARTAAVNFSTNSS